MDPNSTNQPSIKSPILKCTTAIGAAGGANSGLAETASNQLLGDSVQYPDWFNLLMALPWGSIASMCAAIYTLALLSEWFWKRILSPVLVRVGLRDPQRHMSAEEWAKMYKSSKDD